MLIDKYVILIQLEIGLKTVYKIYQFLCTIILQALSKVFSILSMLPSQPSARVTTNSGQSKASDTDQSPDHAPTIMDSSLRKHRSVDDRDDDDNIIPTNLNVRTPFIAIGVLLSYVAHQTLFTY